MGNEQSKRGDIPVNGPSHSTLSPPSPATSFSSSSTSISSRRSGAGGKRSQTASPAPLSTHGMASSAAPFGPLSPPPGPSKPWWDGEGNLRLPPMLEVLNLAQQGMARRETMAMMRALEGNKSIRELNLAGNKLHDSGVEVLAALLHTDALLERLDLSSNGITDRGVTFLARAIAANPKLALVELRLCFNSLTDTSCAHLAQCVKNNSTLMRADLSGNSAVSMNGKHLLHAMRSRPALVAAGKAILPTSPPRPGFSEEVQLTDARDMLTVTDSERRSASAHTSPVHARLAHHGHSRSTFASPQQSSTADPRTSSFSLAAPMSNQLHIAAAANFSAPNSPQHALASAEDEADFSSQPAAAAATKAHANGTSSTAGAPLLSRKGQAKQAELLSHERRVELDLDAELQRLRGHPADKVSAALLEQVFNILRHDDAQMSRFVELSVAFRQGSIPVGSFYTFVLESLRFQGLKASMPMMLVALNSAPERQMQLKKAHIEYCCVKMLLAEKKEAQARGENTLPAFGGQPSSEKPSMEINTAVEPTAFDALLRRTAAATAAATADDKDGFVSPTTAAVAEADTPVFSKLGNFPSQQSKAPPLFDEQPVLPAFNVPIATAAPSVPPAAAPTAATVAAAQTPVAPIPTKGVAASSLAAQNAIAVPPRARTPGAPVTAAAAPAAATATTFSKSASPPVSSSATSSSSSSSSSFTPSSSLDLPADVPDSSVLAIFMRDKAKRAAAAAAAQAAMEAREVAAAEAARIKEEAAAKKKAEEATKKAAEALKKEQAAAEKRAAEAAKAAAAEAERVRRLAEKAEKARIEREKRDAEEAAARARAAQVAAEKAAAVEAALRAKREAEAAAAAETAARVAREEEERIARRLKRAAELEEAARAAEAARVAEAQAAEQEAARKKARREAREAEKERARLLAEQEAATESAAHDAASQRRKEKDQEKLRRLVAEAEAAAAVAAADAAEVDRITLMEEEGLMGEAVDANGAASAVEDKEAKRLRKEQKRIKREAKEARRIEREKLAAQQPQPQAPPPPTQFATPPPAAHSASASASSAANNSSSSEPADVVSRWAARYTAQLPTIFVPPIPPPIPDAPLAASNSFIPYEEEVALQRAEQARRARIAALHVAYQQAQADAAKRDRDQAAIKPDVLPLLLNLHLVFPPLDESTGRPLPAGTLYPFSLALQSDSSPAAVKKAFLKASIVVHPDKQAKSDANRGQLSSLIFPLLRDAYQNFTAKLA